MKSFFLLMLTIFICLLAGRNLISGWQLFDIMPFDIKEFGYIKDYSFSLWEKMLVQFNPLVFSLSPIVLLSLIFLWARMIFKKKGDYFFYTFSITFFILTYFLAYIFMDIVTIVRYSILLYPLLSFLAALGFWQIYLLLKKYGQKLQIAITLIILVFSVLSLFLIQPFYFNYTNFLLPQKYIISDSWGYGGYEAAQYLNSLPNPERITIWADYYGVCEFFIGKCITDYTLATGKYPIDYYVLTRRGGIRYMQSQSKWDSPNGVRVLPYYENHQPLWKLEIDNRPGNFIKIFKSD